MTDDARIPADLRPALLALERTASELGYVGATVRAKVNAKGDLVLALILPAIGSRRWTNAKIDGRERGRLERQKRS
jgi:hypothetical protein